ncbi:histidine-containing phosphotransfer protein 1-like [Punica granatum]|uniref:Histidine-containing phosphotransfer protein n=2 Tax=Punica granatum TaxID=22663 RepID=A0A2I0KQ17_PUNGR|nr:histidine-containing phosphotransfer protein 1-like [Punica granatum]PKI70571.1 hypothetical protein CRG98_009076 [Punica granatum]
MSGFHGHSQPPAMAVLDQLLRQYVEYMESLRRESILDDQFTQLQKLQDESNPDFIDEVITLFFQDSERLICSMGTALAKRNVDYKQVDDDVHQLKGSSSSIGAARVKNLCVFFRDCCEAKNLEKCYRCLQEVQQECVLLKNKLNTLFMLQKQIVAAGGSIPVD